MYDFVSEYYVRDYAASKSIAIFIFCAIAAIFALAYFVLRYGIAESRWVPVFALAVAIVVMGYLAMPQVVVECTPWLEGRFRIVGCPSWYRGLW